MLSTMPPGGMPPRPASSLPPRESASRHLASITSHSAIEGDDAFDLDPVSLCAAVRSLAYAAHRTQFGSHEERRQVSAQAQKLDAQLQLLRERQGLPLADLGKWLAALRLLIDTQ